MKTKVALLASSTTLAGVLTFAGSALACVGSTVDDPQGASGQWPQQFELAEFQDQCGDLSFQENPIFESMDVPALADRLPSEPLVVQPYHEIGSYGGTMKGLAKKLESGTSEILSWRQVNLVRISDDMVTVVPNVAKGWEFNDDYSEITFHLREGHRWSDGAPFTADDIVFYINDFILNKDLNPSVRPEWLVNGEPVAVTKMDDHTVKFSFAAPYPGILNYMATRWFVPYAPKHFLKEMHADYNPAAGDLAKAEGFDDWTKLYYSWWGRWQDAKNRVGIPTLESHILAGPPTTEERQFVANPYYFKVDTAGNQLPYITNMNERFMNQELFPLQVIDGNVDQKAQGLNLRDFPLLKENEAAGDYTVQMPSTGAGTGLFYAFNQTHEDPELRAVYSDLRFRNAMSHAINREEINEVAYLGQGVPQAATPEPGASYLTDDMLTHRINFDPEAASALLDEMGLTEKNSDGIRLLPSGKPLTVLLQYTIQAGPVEVHSLVKEYWESVGVGVQLKEITTEAYRDVTTSNSHDVATWSWGNKFEPQIFGNPAYFIPPFNDNEPYFGLEWRQWILSNGEQGEEPTDVVKEQWALVDEFKSTLPGSDRYREIGEELSWLLLNDMQVILTVGQLPAPTVVSNKLGNTIEYPVQSSGFARSYMVRPDQWYFKN